MVKELGYDSDGTHVLHADRSPYQDPYTEDPVILDNNPLSLASYILEYEDD